jgi:hypothetical protein
MTKKQLKIDEFLGLLEKEVGEKKKEKFREMYFDNTYQITIKGFFINQLREKKEKQEFLDYIRRLTPKIAYVVAVIKDKGIIIAFSKNSYQYGTNYNDDGWLMFFGKDGLRMRIGNKFITLEIDEKYIKRLKSKLSNLFLTSYSGDKSNKDLIITLREAGEALINALKDATKKDDPVGLDFKKAQYIDKTAELIIPIKKKS